MQYQVMSYSRLVGFGDLDAALGLDADGLLTWLRGSYSREAVKLLDSREAATKFAAGLAPHVPGGRVGVIPAAPLAGEG